MFRRLIAPPPTSAAAYIDLKKKVEAYTYTPPRRPPCARDVLARVLAIERRILISLERRERHLPFAGEPQVDRDIEFQERCVAEALEEIRFLLRRSLVQSFHALEEATEAWRAYGDSPLAGARRLRRVLTGYRHGNVAGDRA